MSGFNSQSFSANQHLRVSSVLKEVILTKRRRKVLLRLALHAHMTFYQIVAYLFGFYCLFILFQIKMR